MTLWLNKIISIFFLLLSGLIFQNASVIRSKTLFSITAVVESCININLTSHIILTAMKAGSSSSPLKSGGKGNEHLNQHCIVWVSRQYLASSKSTFPIRICWYTWVILYTSFNKKITLVYLHVLIGNVDLLLPTQLILRDMEILTSYILSTNSNYNW